MKTIIPAAVGVLEGTKSLIPQSLKILTGTSNLPKTAISSTTELVKPEGVMGKVADATQFMIGDVLRNPALRAWEHNPNEASKIGLLAMDGTNLLVNTDGSVPRPDSYSTTVQNYHRAMSHPMHNALEELFMNYKKQGGELSQHSFEVQMTDDMYRGQSDLPGVMDFFQTGEHSRVFNEMLDRNIYTEQLPEDYRLKPGTFYKPVNHDPELIMKDYGGALTAYTEAARLGARTRVNDLQNIIDDFRQQVTNAETNGQALDTIPKYEQLKALYKEYDILSNRLSKGKFNDIPEVFFKRLFEGELDNVTSTYFQDPATQSIKLHLDIPTIHKYLRKDSYRKIADAAFFDHSVVQSAIANPILGKDMGTLIDNMNKTHMELLKLHEDNPEARAHIQEKFDDTMKTLKLSYNRARGRLPDGTNIVTPGHKILRGINIFTNSKLLATTGLAQFGDLGSFIADMATGHMGRFAKQLVPEFEGIAKFLNKDNLLELGALAELLKDPRLMAIFDGTSSTQTFTSQSEQVLNFASQLIHLSGGAAIMNNFSRVLASQQLTRDLLGLFSTVKNGKASVEDITELHRLGYTEKLAKKHLELAVNTIEDVDGVKGINFSSWKLEDRVKFFSTITRELDSEYTIVPNGQSLPHFMQGSSKVWYGIGKLMGVLKSFLYRAMEVYTFRSLQKPDGRAALKFFIRTLLGMVSYLSKRAVAGVKWAEQDVRPERLIWEGLNRGGAISGFDMTAQFLDSLDKTFNTKIGPNSLLKLNAAKRYANPDLIYQLAGPSATFAKDLNSLAKSLGSGKFSKQGVKFMMQYTPFLNSPPGQMLQNVFSK